MSKMPTKQKSKNSKKPIVKILHLEQTTEQVSGTIYISEIPSSNRRLILHPYAKLLILNPTYRQIKETLLKNAQTLNKLNGQEFKLTMDIQKFSKTQSAADIDNILKILIDGFIEPIIENDNKITEIHITRKIIKTIPELFKTNPEFKLDNPRKRNFGYLISFILNKKQ